MFRSFPRTRESRATSGGVCGPWVPAFAGTSGDEERFDLIGTCSGRRRYRFCRKKAAISASIR
jgi:hypothetical protein